MATKTTTTKTSTPKPSPIPGFKISRSGALTDSKGNATPVTIGGKTFSNVKQTGGRSNKELVDYASTENVQSPTPTTEPIQPTPTAAPIQQPPTPTAETITPQEQLKQAQTSGLPVPQDGARGLSSKPARAAVFRREGR